MSERIYLFDTTLRDGEQSPGYGMTAEQKLVLARQLEELGVDVIEAGFPAASPEDLSGVRQIAHAVKHARVAALARCNDGDIDAAARGLEPTERGRLHLFFGTSQLHLQHKTGLDRSAALDLIVRSVRRGKQLFSELEFSPEDATRTDEDFLIEVVQAVVDEGVQVVNVPDTVGYTVPEEYTRRIRLLKERVRGIEGVILSTHCHNDLGLAVANSLAAIQAGARQVECTINGIGERAGNASLEEIVTALRVREDCLPFTTSVRHELLYQTSQLLSALTGVSTQPNKAIVGRNAFAHESGVHQQGLLKDRRTYEIMTPESVGAPPSQLVLGRHSGRRALAARLTELGYTLSAAELNHVYDRFLKACEVGKALDDDDLVALALDNRPPPEPPYAINLVQATAGTVKPATATVQLTRSGETFAACALGDGPVDAAYSAVDTITGYPTEVVAYELRAVGTGRDTEGEVFVRVQIADKTFSGRAVDTDIVAASVKAYLSAVNKALSARNQIRPPQVAAAKHAPQIIQQL